MYPLYKQLLSPQTKQNDLQRAKLNVMSVCSPLTSGQEASAGVMTPVRPRTATWGISHLITLLICISCFVLFTLQVTVKMYRRGSQGWLGKSLNATATIPSDTFVLFRISGEEADTKIPASTIHSITLSKWQCVSVSKEDMVPQGEEPFSFRNSDAKQTLNLALSGFYCSTFFLSFSNAHSSKETRLQTSLIRCSSLAILC